MDNRDKQLQRHMTMRMTLASQLPIERQCRWAQKCVAMALRQQRTAFYLMARMWLASVSPS